MTYSLPEFLDESVSPGHLAECISKMLLDAGYTRTPDTGKWFQIIDGSSVIAVRIPESPSGIRGIAAHSDSPGFRLKPAGPHRSNGMMTWAAEVYGGALLYTWFDRPLGIAGRICYEDGSGITCKLVRSDRAIATIPSLAIHLNRDVNNSGFRPDRQSELVPVTGLAGAESVAEFLNVTTGANISGESLAFDLCLFETQPASLIGADQSLLSSGRLDNAVSAWSATRAFLESDSGRDVCVLAVFDHEEVGSESHKGAYSGHLQELLSGLVAAGIPAGDQAIFLSADMAHAWHPNYPQLHDPHHRPLAGGGVVIKKHAGQNYASDLRMEASLRAWGERNKKPLQTYIHRNDLPCGSTIGPMMSRFARTLEIGAPMLAMHSARELMAAHDANQYLELMKAFYSGDFGK